MNLRADGEQDQGSPQRLATVQRREQVRVLLPEIDEGVRPHSLIKHALTGICHDGNCLISSWRMILPEGFFGRSSANRTSRGRL